LHIGWIFSQVAAIRKNVTDWESAWIWLAAVTQLKWLISTWANMTCSSSSGVYCKELGKWLKFHSAWSMVTLHMSLNEKDTNKNKLTTISTTIANSRKKGIFVQHSVLGNFSMQQQQTFILNKLLWILNSFLARTSKCCIRGAISDTENMTVKDCNVHKHDWTLSNANKQTNSTHTNKPQQKLVYVYLQVPLADFIYARMQKHVCLCFLVWFGVCLFS